MGDDLGCNNIQKHGAREVLQNYQYDKGKGSKRGSFIFIFRLDIFLCDSYQVDEVVMEIEEWNQKVPDDYVKSFSRVLLETSSVGDISCILKKLYYMNFHCIVAV